MAEILNCAELQTLYEFCENKLKQLTIFQPIIEVYKEVLLSIYSFYYFLNFTKHIGYKNRESHI